MDTIQLDIPATTRDALRAQAKMLEIAGRGAMNKEELHAAVSREISRRVAGALLNGTDDALSLDIGTDGKGTITLPAVQVKATRALIDATHVIDIDPMSTPRTVWGAKGAGIHMTRAGRLDYPAKRTPKGRKGVKRGGRK